MIKKIYSKVQKGKLLHMVFDINKADEGRYEVIDEKEFIQLAALRYEKGKTFPPHKHIYKKSPEKCIAQESWVIIKGKVKVFFYDLDGTLISEEILNQGVCSITLYGGHTYEILEENTLVLEYKTGPYQGHALDKEFI